MNRNMIWLPVMLLLLGSGMAIAQTSSVKQGNGDGPEPDHFANAAKGENQAQPAMYEDIEIMRRLVSSRLVKLISSEALENGCARCHDTTAHTTPRSLGLGNGNLNELQQGKGEEWLRRAVPSVDTNAPNEVFTLLRHTGDPHGNINWIGVEELHPLDVEGSYLQGYGIVYTVTLPPPQPKPKTESTKPQPKPLSDWERIRKQLHGEEQPDQGQQISAQPKEPSLTDVILQTLFDNGHHLSRLNANEKLTVAITFRPVEPQGGQVTAANSNGKPLASGTQSLTGEGAAGIISSSGSTAVGDPGTGTVTKAFSSTRDYLLLGDLHMRRGEANEALNAYRSALNQLSPMADDNDALSQLLELHRKLGQAYLSLTDLRNVRKEIDWLEKHEKRQAPKRDNSGKPAETRLPSKLLISAPKGLLDQAGAGKISFENFKKGVAVEELNFSKGNAAPPTWGKK